MDALKSRSIASLVQGIYYLLTGLLPVFSIRAFEAVLGEREEHWLVKTHSLMLGAIGAVLIWAGLRKSASPEVPALAMGAAAGLAAPELYYMAKGRIQRSYLLDILPQAAFIGLWAWALSRSAFVIGKRL